MTYGFIQTRTDPYYIRRISLHTIIKPNHLCDHRVFPDTIIKSNIRKVKKRTTMSSDPQPKIPILPSHADHLLVIPTDFFPYLLSVQSTGIYEVCSDQR